MTKPTIFFDWDGTLCDSMDLCIEENRTTLRTMGLPDQPDEVLRRCNGPTFEEAAPIIGIPADRMAEYCRIRLSCALALVPRVNRLFPGARELLFALKDKADLCIVSNATRDYLALCMQQFGLEDVFLRMAWSRPERTKAQNLAHLLAELQPERAVMVGDRIGDIRAGRANGLPTIAAAFGYGSDAEYAEADFRANTMAELQDMLLRFTRNEGGLPHVH
ncbi:MAG: HAD family hydrolase [Aristaeellaceae bacterium]